MGHLIAGFGTSHTGMMIRAYNPSDDAQRRVHEGFRQISEEIDAYAPDTIIVIGSEHLNSFSLDNMPQICVGIGDTCVGWGDAGIDTANVPLASELAASLLSDGVRNGFDLSFSANPKLDHGFMAPLHLIRPQMDIPIVPVFQNASMDPLSPLRRSAQFGALVRDVVERSDRTGRVVLLATGGLSHWVGTPEMGRINEEFDTWFLDCVVRGDLKSVLSIDTDEITQIAGNGAQEIRNWVAVMAAGGASGTVFAYESVPAWLTGIGVARLF